MLARLCNHTSRDPESVSFRKGYPTNHRVDSSREIEVQGVLDKQCLTDVCFEALYWETLARTVLTYISTPSTPGDDENEDEKIDQFFRMGLI